MGLHTEVGAQGSWWSDAVSVLPLLSLPSHSLTLAGATCSAQLPSAHKSTLEKLSLS